MKTEKETGSAKKAPKVSVILPVYNAEKYIEECINSVLSQTMRDFEVIVINDASTDNSPKLCEKYLGDKRISLKHNEVNCGQGITRNKGLDIARGEYVYFLDSDDIIAPNALETMLKAAEQTDADVVHMSAYYYGKWDDNKRQYVNYVVEEPVKDFPKDILARMEHWVRSHLTSPMVWLNLFRRDFLVKNSLRFADMISEDETFAFAVYCFADKVYKINDILYIYRKREGSIMNRNNEERLKEGLKGIVAGVSYLDEVMNRCAAFKENIVLRLRMQYFLLEKLIRIHISPFYENPKKDGINLMILAQKTFEPMLKEHTTLVNLLLYQLQLYTGNAKKITEQMKQNQATLSRGF